MEPLGSLSRLWAYCGCLLGHFGEHWGPLRRLWAPLGGLGGSLGGHWELLGLTLEALVCILGRLGLPKLAQSGPECHLADMANTHENRRFLRVDGLEAAKLAPKWHTGGLGCSSWVPGVLRG